MADDLKEYIPQMLEYAEGGFPLEQFYCSVKDQFTTLPMIYWLCSLELEGAGRRKKRAVRQAYEAFIRKDGDIPPEELAGWLNTDVKTVLRAFPYPRTTSPPFSMHVPRMSVVGNHLKRSLPNVGVAWNQPLRVDRRGRPNAIRLDVLDEIVCGILKMDPRKMLELIETCARRGVQAPIRTVPIFGTLVAAESPLSAEDVAAKLGLKESEVRATLENFCRTGIAKKLRDRRYYLTGKGL